jgi:hypothetical protein
MKNAVFWDVAPCRSCEMDRRFGGTYCLHLQVEKSASEEPAWASSSRPAADFSTWRWRQYVPPKRRSISQDLHGATSQKTAFFIATAMKTSNPTYYSDVFDQRIGFSVKLTTYIPDIQIRPHPCCLHCTLLIVYQNAVNVDCLVLHGHVRGAPNLNTDSITAWRLPCTAVATPSANFSQNVLSRGPSLIVTIEILYPSYWRNIRDTSLKQLTLYQPIAWQYKYTFQKNLFLIWTWNTCHLINAVTCFP